MDWILPAIPIFKAVHIVALIVWVGGLIALPIMLKRHGPEIPLEDYRVIRRASHITYILCVTPASVIAVIAGTWLIFMRDVFTPWFYAKLAFVALLVLAHAWIGHILVQIGEKPSEHRSPPPYLPIAFVILPTLLILFLVLAKPQLAWISFPEWLTNPRGGQLLFDVPRR